MWSHFVLALSLISLTACTTLSGGRNSPERAGASSLTFTKEPIVHQTSGRNIMRRLDRDAWVGIRNSSKNEHIKLYATLGAGEWDVAVLDARAYLQRFPKDEVALTVLSLGLAMKQNYSLAAYYAHLLDELHPGNPEVHNILGLAAMHKPGAGIEDYKEAMKHFETAFDASGQQIASGMNLAHLYLEMGNAQAARDIFQAVRTRCDDCMEATMGYGIALSRMQEYKKAESAFLEVLQKDPHSAYARFYLALVAKYGRNDNKTAIAYLTALLEDTEVKNVEIQRKSNFLLRRIQAQVYGQPKEAIAAEERPTRPKKSKTAQPPAVDESDLEQVINAE
jgi:tetratricopeptide (TPR) repeat protein